ncbi:MAG: PD-(D/E)XK nuclease domain-containing protein, partial [Succinivibrio sp.]
GANISAADIDGDGYADIALTSYGADQAVVIELKVRRTDGSLTEAASEAVRQIEERGYAQKFIDSKDIETVTAIGIAFCKRICRIETKILKGGSEEQGKPQGAKMH